MLAIHCFIEHFTARWIERCMQHDRLGQPCNAPSLPKVSDLGRGLLQIVVPLEQRRNHAVYGSNVSFQKSRTGLSSDLRARLIGARDRIIAVSYAVYLKGDPCLCDCFGRRLNRQEEQHRPKSSTRKKLLTSETVQAQIAGVASSNPGREMAFS